MNFRNVFIIIAFVCTRGFSQDKVVLLGGDTVNVFIPGDPRKETDLNHTAIGSLNDYGFRRVIAVYGKDSVRVHFPGQIREYIRAKTGAYLGSGFFFSKTLDEKLLVFRLTGTREVFFQRVNFHKDLIIWHYREDLGHAMPQSYFYAEQKGAPGLVRINTYREWKKWVVFHPPLDSLSQTVPAPKKRGKKAVGSYFNYLVEVMDKYKNLYP
jgi:hypothetical protein